MSNNQVASSQSKWIKKFPLFALSAAFFLLTFTVGFNHWVIFILSLLILGLSIYSARDYFKKFDYLSLFILLIPIVSLTLLYALCPFANYYSDTLTRALTPFSIIAFTCSGILLAKLGKEYIKHIFIGLLAGLLLITIINTIINMVQLGMFYGYRYSDYFSYYDGVRSVNSISGSSFILLGFSVTLAPVQMFLVYPCLLSLVTFFYLFNDRRCKYNIIFSSVCAFVSIMAFLTVLSKVTLLSFIANLVLIAVMAFFAIKPKLFNKWVKIGLIVLFGLFLVLAILFFLNAQYNNVAIRNAFANNYFFNHLFNANRYVEPMNVMLNGLFSKEKLLGFPIYFDQAYEKTCYPSNNFFVNQFMYIGILGFLFILVLAGLFIYSFISLRKNKELDTFKKYIPFVFVVGFAVTFFFNDVGNTSVYGITTSSLYMSSNNPLFLIALFMLAYQYSLSIGGNRNEK